MSNLISLTELIHLADCLFGTLKKIIICITFSGTWSAWNTSSVVKYLHLRFSVPPPFQKESSDYRATSGPETRWNSWHTGGISYCIHLLLLQQLHLPCEFSGSSIGSALSCDQFLLSYWNSNMWRCYHDSSRACIKVVLCLQTTCFEPVPSRTLPEFPNWNPTTALSNLLTVFPLRNLSQLRPSHEIGLRLGHLTYTW